MATFRDSPSRVAAAYVGPACRELHGGVEWMRKQLGFAPPKRGRDETQYWNDQLERVITNNDKFLSGEFGAMRADLSERASALKDSIFVDDSFEDFVEAILGTVPQTKHREMLLAVSIKTGDMIKFLDKGKMQDFQRNLLWLVWMLHPARHAHASAMEYDMRKIACQLWGPVRTLGDVGTAQAEFRHRFVTKVRKLCCVDGVRIMDDKETEELFEKYRRKYMEREVRRPRLKPLQIEDGER